MKAYTPSGITWEWAHQRNRSLLQGNLFCDGLKGNGYFPAVRFCRKNYLSVLMENRGENFFYPKEELAENTCRFQEDIDSGRCTAEKLAQLSARFFAEVEKTANALSAGDLAALADHELLSRFQAFKTAMTVGPIITVQLWGIEACWDPAYRLERFLEKRLGELGRADRMYDYVEALSTTKRMMVPLEAEAVFFALCATFQKDPNISKIIREEKTEEGLAALSVYPSLSNAFQEHVGKYSWMTREYQSPPWTEAQWMEKIKKYLEKDNAKELENLQAKHRASFVRKQKIIQELAPPIDVSRILDVFDELLWQRDWSKGEYVKAFLHWQPFLRELAERMNVTVEEVGFCTLDEVEEFLKTRSGVPKNELSRRKKRCVVISDAKSFNVFSNGVDDILRQERVATFFSDKEGSEITGTVACPGNVSAKVRVITNAAEKETVLPGEILVTYMTTVEFTHLFSKLAGLITDEGGMSSHAAIVSREFNLPCLIGTKNATRVFKTGDFVELDATSGIARKIRGR